MGRAGVIAMQVLKASALAWGTACIVAVLFALSSAISFHDSFPKSALGVGLVTFAIACGSMAGPGVLEGAGTRSRISILPNEAPPHESGETSPDDAERRGGVGFTVLAFAVSIELVAYGFFFWPKT